MKEIKLILFFIFILLSNAFSQVIVSIKDFGAKGDGKTNDQIAFEKASKFLNSKKQNVQLFLPKGTYIVGGQSEKNTNNIYIEGSTVLELNNLSHIKIFGENGTKIKYADKLKFGSFNPSTSLPNGNKTPFNDKSKIAQIGCAILMKNCTSIEISNIELDGNLPNVILGSPWGDTGYQLWHYGFHISYSKNIIISHVNTHHFACDGISVSGSGKEEMNIKLLNSSFEYNGRQGFSWIGGKGVYVENCKFNHTGKSKLSSSPSAGIDIEAEDGNEVKNGQFLNCEFINNVGCGLLAETGPSKNITFTNCTFWGTTNWSAWVNKPKYTFNTCNFYGSFVHGYVTTKFEDATKFYGCNFEDKKYNGQEVYGSMLFESDGRKMMIFENCVFTANRKKIMWFNGIYTSNEIEKAVFKNCVINVKNQNLIKGDFFAVMRKMKMENVTFNYSFPKENKYYLSADNNLTKNIIVNYIKK